MFTHYIHICISLSLSLSIHIYIYLSISIYIYIYTYMHRLSNAERISRHVPGYLFWRARKETSPAREGPFFYLGTHNAHPARTLGQS